MGIYYKSIEEENKLLEKAKKEELKFDSDDKYDESIIMRKNVKGKSQELYGRVFFKNNKYDTLLSVSGNIHGFDGIFQQNEKIYFYESKLKKSGIDNCLYDAEKTINNIKGKQTSSNRMSQLINSKKNLKEINELKLLDNLILRQKEGISLCIPNERQLYALGSIMAMKKVTNTTKKKLENKADVLIIKYDKI